MDEYTAKVGAERQRQLRQGKAEDNTQTEWHLVVADQLAMITRVLSLARYEGLVTKSGGQENLTVGEAASIKLGLVRLGACAQAWYEHLED